MSNNKYITFAARKDDIDYCCFLRFNEHLVHADVAQAMLPCIALSYSVPVEDVRVLGAGFIHDTHVLGAECYGESDSLNVKSRGALDAKIINWPFSTYIADVEDESEGCETDSGTKASHETR